MEKMLRDHDDAQVTEALNRVYEREPSALEPGLATLQSRSLPREVW
jgi:hypothetical protein